MVSLLLLLFFYCNNNFNSVMLYKTLQITPCPHYLKSIPLFAFFFPRKLKACTRRVGAKRY